jgi:hypothetical protein
MVDLCVMCGNILPAENNSMVCHDCKLTAGIRFMRIACPECGKLMDVWHKEVVNYTPPNAYCPQGDITINLLYHCECGCDWESRYDSIYGDEFYTAPKRHYWG